MERGGEADASPRVYYLGSRATGERSQVICFCPRFGMDITGLGTRPTIYSDAPLIIEERCLVHYDTQMLSRTVFWT
jgi:hypothetical protein